MSQRLPDSKIVIYGDAGHGFLFQHPEAFGDEVSGSRCGGGEGGR